MLLTFSGEKNVSQVELPLVEPENSTDLTVKVDFETRVGVYENCRCFFCGEAYYTPQQRPVNQAPQCREYAARSGFARKLRNPTHSSDNPNGLLNPTHGSGWIIQIVSTRNLKS
jgi:hypothetical protein